MDAGLLWEFDLLCWMCNESALNKNNLIALHAVQCCSEGTNCCLRASQNVCAGNGLEDKVSTGIYVPRVRFCQTRGCWNKHPSYFKDKNPLHLVEGVYNMHRHQNTQRAWGNKFEVVSRAKRLMKLHDLCEHSREVLVFGWEIERDRSKFEMGRWFSFSIPSKEEAAKLLWRNCWQAHCDFMDTHNWHRSEQSAFPTFPCFPGEIEENILIS